MRYQIPDPYHPALLPLLISAEDALARLDERANRHVVEDGFRERGHFFDAAAALWVAGELVHVEDLVLHDAHMDARAPTHELTIARSILRARRRIWLAEPAWALSLPGLATLRGEQGSAPNAGDGLAATRPEPPSTSDDDSAQLEEEEEANPMAAEFAAIDAAITGIGITRVLSYQAAAAIKAGRLKVLLQPYELPEIPVSLVHPQARLTPPKVRVFLDFVAPRLRQRLSAVQT